MINFTCLKFVQTIFLKKNFKMTKTKENYQKMKIPGSTVRNIKQNNEKSNKLAKYETSRDKLAVLSRQMNVFLKIKKNLFGFFTKGSTEKLVISNFYLS